MARYLTEAAVVQLRRLQADVNAIKAELKAAIRPTDQAAPHFLVLTPADGIPGADGAEPGEAVCTISRRWGASKDIEDTDREVTVYNSGPEIGGDSWVVAHKDSWGDLWAVEDGGLRFIKAPSGGIPGRAGSLLGYATCDVYSTGTTDYTLSDTGVNIEVVNWASAAVCANGDRYGMAGWWAGRWWVISEDCGNTSEGANRSANASSTSGSSNDPLGTPQSGTALERGRTGVPSDKAPFESAGSPGGPDEEP